MAIKCGRGPHYHETLNDVRACYNGEDVEAKPVTGPANTIVADEPDATEKQISFVCSLAEQKLAPAAASVVKRQAGEGHWGRRSISEEINRLKMLPRFVADSDVITDTDREPEYDSATYDFRPNGKATESVATAQTPVTLEAGMYRMGETIYKVQLAVHGSGNPYAKRLVQIEVTVDPSRVLDVTEKVWKFEYAPGAIRDLRPEHRMTLEEAKEFGALYGTCCVCGRTLTNETSIEAGIGPVCGGRV